MRCVCILGLREEGLHETVMDGEQDEMYVCVCVLSQGAGTAWNCHKQIKPFSESSGQTR